MTLNTFHNAGISSKNVTLGVPRLNEVINVARQIKTPSLKIFLDPSISKNEKEVYKLGAQIEYTNLSHLISDWGVYYDPDPTTTIIDEDKALVELYQETKEVQSDRDPSRWLIRFKIDGEKTKGVFNEYFEFKRDVVNKIESQINNPVSFEIVSSEDTNSTQVIRVRLYDMDEMDDSELVIGCRGLAESILEEITLRGFEKITKVSFSKSGNDSKRWFYEKDSGAYKEDKDNWIIETDGVDLASVLALEGIDSKRTTSNSITEILVVLGIEATRMSLIRELRVILRSYDIYVNYRHLATLVDMMTQRGILTSITRHGINRVNSGPLRKCSFEETVEILFEAAFFGEHDPLTGISENVIFGQLAQYGTGFVDLIVDG
jgi:DNA-directed RNA polymerase II subunit RPB1